jgi:hypothetical protein
MFLLPSTYDKVPSTPNEEESILRAPAPKVIELGRLEHAG